MKACILVGTAPDEAFGIAAALDRSRHVRSAFAVLGRPEVVLRVEVTDLAELGHLIQQISATDGVLVSETLLELPAEAMA